MRFHTRMGDSSNDRTSESPLRRLKVLITRSVVIAVLTCNVSVIDEQDPAELRRFLEWLTVAKEHRAMGMPKQQALLMRFHDQIWRYLQEVSHDIDERGPSYNLTAFQGSCCGPR